MIEQNEYVDSYGYKFVIDTQKHSPISGGQGVVVWTAEPNLLLKLVFAEGSSVLNKDDSQNEKYMDIRLLPVPARMNIALPQAVLQGVEGYVMTLLEDMEEFEKHFSVTYNYIPETSFIKALAAGNESVSKFLCGYMGQGGIRRRYLAYMKVATMLAQLHANDLVYCDFSPRNVFISNDLNYQEVWFIDSDNLRYSENNDSNIYTPKFGAPEVVNGDGDCSFYSDSYSFAVSLFKQLFSQHPFEGVQYDNKVDETDDLQIADDMIDHGQYGWILDSESDNFDDQRLMLPYQIVLTDELYRLFQNEFSEVSRLENEYIRPSLSEWAMQLSYAFDNVIYAQDCGLDYMADGTLFYKCPWDQKEIPSIRITSYFSNQYGERCVEQALWQFTHELNSNVIDVPLRMLHGFRCDEQNEKAFSVSIKDGRVMIQSELSYPYEVSFSEDDIIFRKYGRYKTMSDNVSILCHQKTDNDKGLQERYIRLEVTIKW